MRHSSLALLTALSYPCSGSRSAIQCAVQRTAFLLQEDDAT